MIKEQQDVKDFMAGVGQDVPEKAVEHISGKVAMLRVDLIQEELDELTEAFGLETRNIGGVEVRGQFGTYKPIDAADALADLLYVVYGTAVACGFDMEPIWNEVQRSNMTKLVDGYKREDGKWMKGPSYSPAKLGPIVRAQR